MNLSPILVHLYYSGSPLSVFIRGIHMSLLHQGKLLL
jgi:hypothetical protein